MFRTTKASSGDVFYCETYTKYVPRKVFLQKLIEYFKGQHYNVILATELRRIQGNVTVLLLSVFS